LKELTHPAGVPASQRAISHVPREREKSSDSPLVHTYGFTVLSGLVYLVGAIACLWQWNSARPWERIDAFSGGFLALSVCWGLGMLWYHRPIYRSEEVMREAAGVTYDPWMLRWIVLFGFAEWTVYLDYGHWHLAPVLENHILQTIGLALYFFATVWLIWTDRYLSRVFAGELSERKVMTQGPYRFVRHPRYAALIGARVALALALGSVLGWILFIGWLWVNLKRVELEENHLRGLFGEAYDRYAKRTARFVPGIY
jgi:protein-S-isoprenylcysteine O-methyltransferase Ste14